MTEQTIITEEKKGLQQEDALREEERKKALASLPTGKLTYTLRNDYMFKAVLQKNKRALSGLLCALLGYRESQIQDIELLNPIELGKAVDEKTCILDLKLVLNNATILNLEMQVNSLDSWPERSLLYLCRAFDHLKSGEDYSETQETMHIGILDFHIKHLTPQFYAEFKMINTINHEVYSDKMVLRVLDLKVVEELLASGREPGAEELFGERAGAGAVPANYEELYEWAKLFKATTWEEMKKLAAENEDIAETIVTYHEMSEDEKIREQCEARERYDHDKASYIGMGRREGEKIGLEKGLSQGEKIGLEKGLSQGEKIGLEKGLSLGLQGIISLVRGGRLKEAEAAGLSNMTVEEFRKYLNQKEDH